jgi:hypothetical protein
METSAVQPLFPREKWLLSKNTCKKYPVQAHYRAGIKLLKLLNIRARLLNLQRLLYG